MEDLLSINSEVIRPVLPLLLKDKTTKRNILWATGSYAHLGGTYSEQQQIQRDQVAGLFAADLQPRVTKDAQAQATRTKKKAEVFTPSWICNKMNNYCDEDWFGRPDVFNVEGEQSWTPTVDRIVFPPGKTWQQYVDSRRLEITCGEAPFIVSRYDTSTGEIIPLERRIGVLDRKMRIINENAQTEDEWFKWTVRAFQSVYGYEYQGDNLLIARINLVNTFVDYVYERWNRNPTIKELRSVANIVSWNFWQMDGFKNTVPFAAPQQKSELEQISLLDDLQQEERTGTCSACRVFDWRDDRSMPYTDIIQKG